MSLKASPVLLFVSCCLFLGLLFAFYVEHYLGIEPCYLCYVQRYLFIFGIVVSLLGIFTVMRFERIKYLVLFALLLNTGFSFYHVGVEQKWWKGPSSCITSNLALNVDQLSAEDALEQLKKGLEKRKFVPCDQITWRIFDVPATIWNTLFLCGLTFITLVMCCSCQRKAYKHLFRK